MTLVTVRSYKILTILLPVLIALSAYSFLETEAGSILSRLDGMRMVSAKVHSTGVHIRELPEMKADYEKLVRKKITIASSLFGAESEAALYELLLVKAREAGVAIAQMTPRTRRSSAGFAELPLSLEVSGDFDDITHFVGLIENVNRLMRVDEISIGRDREEMVVATIRLMVYVYSDSLSPARAAKGKTETVFQKRESYLAELRNALQVTITPPSYTYTPSGRSDPFGRSGVKPKGTGMVPPVSAKQNHGLALKGILWKDPPLAILETLDGRTFIVKKGEMVNGSTIASIERTQVTIATPQGNHVLQQYSDK